MKILHISPAFPPSEGYGGGPVVAYELCKGLVKRGHEVTVYTTDANRNSRLADGMTNVEGIEVHYFKTLSNSFAYQQKIFISPGMDSAIQNNVNKFDVVHLHDYRTFQNIALFRAWKKWKIPYVLQPHGTISTHTGKMPIKYLFDLIIGNQLLKNSSKILVLNESEGKHCGTEIPDRKLVVLPNGIDFQKYQNIPEYGLFRKKIGIESDKKIILYLGRIHKSKGVDLLLYAYGKKKQTNSEWAKITLVIAGPDDGYVHALKKLAVSLNIEDDVQFTGFLSHEEKLSAFTDASVFITPVFFGFPLTFLESMICGCPIITTNKGDTLNWLDGEIGLVSDYSDTGIAEKIQIILNDESVRSKFSTAAKNQVIQFDWKNIVIELEKIYRDVAEGCQ